MKIENDKKKWAAKLSILSNTCLIGIKIFAGVVSGSISILSEAIHSASDLLASFIAFFSVTESAKPADSDHQFGHGKYEDMAGLFEGLLIILASFYIIFEAVKKFFCVTKCDIDVNLGLIVMLISIIANLFVSRYLFKIAKETDSIALYADGEHLRTDIYSSLAVFLGLLAVKMTGNYIFDPIIAIVVSIIIFVAGYKIFETSKNNLLDSALSKENISKIKNILNEYYGNEIIALKSMKTRKAGMKKNIELTLIVNKHVPIKIAHDLCDKIELQIEEQLKNTDILIHLEPDGE